jgi:tRNA pseudouridine55 synthase
MLSSQDKEYEGIIRLGIETETGDPTGTVTRRADPAAVTRADVDGAAKAFVGSMEQTPPMTSAVKHNGQPLYKLSRKGVEVERRPRTIRIDCFDVLDFEDGAVRFRTRCSKGTYVRTLALEFGERLGVGAHLETLRRTAIGSCRVESAATLETVEKTAPRDLLVRHGLSLADALAEVPGLRLSPGGVRKVRCGVYPTPADMLDFDAVPDPGRFVRLLDPAGELVAVGRSVEPEPTRTPPARVELVRVI